MKRAAAGLLVAGGIVAAAAAVASCSDDTHPVVCGDMRVEGNEQCDDGNTDETDACRMCIAYFAPKNVVKWDFNAEAAPGFTSDGCIDVGAARVRVELTGTAGTFSKDDRCSQRQVDFVELPAGSYTASVTPVDDTGASLVTAPATATVEANVTPSTTVETTVNVGPGLWARAMTGTYLFLVRWGGMTCAAAAPPVVTQVVTLSIGGVPVNAITSSANGLPAYNVNGTQPVACVASTLTIAERVDNLPFGPAQIAVIGRDGTGAEMFRETFPTFIGAGQVNPVIELDVDSTIDAAVDAAIDAPIDAGVDAEIDAPIDAPPDA